MAEPVKWSIERDVLTQSTIVTFRISRYAMCVADFPDPLEAYIFSTQPKTASDVAQDLEILLRLIERGLEEEAAKNSEEVKG